MKKLLATLVLLLVMGGALPSAWAQDYAAAGRYFAAGQDAFAQGNYKKAAEQFQAAYDITRDPVLLFNIGESWQRASDGPKAIRSYQAYLAAQPGAPDRAEVEKRLQALRAGPAGPETKAEAGESPAEPAARQAPPSAPPPEKKPAGERAASPYRTAAWAGVAAAVAFVTAGAVLGLGAQSRAEELQRQTTLLTGGQPLIYDQPQREAYLSLMSEGRAYNDAAIACYVVAGAVAIGSGVLFLVDWRRRGRVDRAALAPQASPRLLSWGF